MACPFACALRGPVVVHLKGKEVKWQKGSCDCRVVKPCWILVVNWERATGFTCTSSIQYRFGPSWAVYIRLYSKALDSFEKEDVVAVAVVEIWDVKQGEAEDELKSRRCRITGFI